jgi:hypothetical protein
MFSKEENKVGSKGGFRWRFKLKRKRICSYKKWQDYAVKILIAI